MSENKLNIARQNNALLRRLGLEPSMTKRLVIEPDKVTVTEYQRHPEHGGKWVDYSHGTDNGAVATTERIIPVRT